MKPLILIKLPDDCSSKEVNDDLAKSVEHLGDDYNIIIYNIAEIKVYALWLNPITYLFNKLKVWLILRTQKNKLF